MLLATASTSAFAAQLSTDARTAIPHDVQQLVVIDYRAMPEFLGGDGSARTRDAARSQAV